MTADDKRAIIDLLVVMTGKGEGYFSNMTEEQLGAEYDRLMIMDPAE